MLKLAPRDHVQSRPATAVKPMTTPQVSGVGRESNQDISAEADLREAAIQMEVVLTETGAYPSEANAYRTESGNTVSVVSASGSTYYCLQTTSESGAVFSYDASEGPQDGPCR